MSRLLEVPTENGDSILLEIAAVEGERLASTELIEKTTKTLESMMRRIKPLAVAAVNAMDESTADRMSLEVGVFVTMEGNVVFASTSAQANFKIVLSWDGKQKG